MAPNSLFLHGIGWFYYHFPEKGLYFVMWELNVLDQLSKMPKKISELPPHLKENKGSIQKK